jgi:ribosomal protein S27E
MSKANLLLATEKSLGQLEAKLTEAREVSSANQLAWVESEATVSALEVEAEQIAAALRALKGEAPLGPSTEPALQQAGPDSPPAEESPEDFEARLKRERGIKEKAKREEGPYAGIKCPSCGSVGTLFDSVKVMKDKPIPIIACEGCGSERPR